MELNITVNKINFPIPQAAHDVRHAKKQAFISAQLLGQMTFWYGLSKPDEHKKFSLENVRALAVKRRPYQNVVKRLKADWPEHAEGARSFCPLLGGVFALGTQCPGGASRPLFLLFSSVFFESKNDRLTFAHNWRF